eukprot:CAMPEP_0202890640 /NCGR_PEP_ID=MMETSP1392-20130828/980_1 /ASSEMBLY_ACC=CAM_ASM_000868 /TAXON_ID=225041 /ORGANISM="Chlamydomonas chlamydogama, Strain SAG 11-48b" /LENGTH=121 /DNA_ID=CAMNT_0049574253 /DNA_START=332 /DNA_END=699 /DNA_ORIENTATION=+
MPSLPSSLAFDGASTTKCMPAVSSAAGDPVPEQMAQRQAELADIQARRRQQEALKLRLQQQELSAAGGAHNNAQPSRLVEHVWQNPAAAWWSMCGGDMQAPAEEVKCRGRRQRRRRYLPSG